LVINDVVKKSKRASGNEEYTQIDPSVFKEEKGGGAQGTDGGGLT